MSTKPLRFADYSRRPHDNHEEHEFTDPAIPFNIAWCSAYKMLSSAAQHATISEDLLLN
jgi:hypothetical protein